MNEIEKNLTSLGENYVLIQFDFFLQVARQMQPSVVYIGDAEKTFMKKIPKTDKVNNDDFILLLIIFLFNNFYFLLKLSFLQTRIISELQMGIEPQLCEL